MQMKRSRFFAMCFGILPLLALAKPLPQPVKNYVAKTAKQYHLSPAYLTYLMQHAKIEPVVIHQLNHPFEAVPYNVYASYFLNKDHINGGIRYWQAHAKVLSAVAKHYQVDPSVIVAIIGVETLYGKGKGEFQELGALSTLAFYRQRRADYFEHELTQFILLSRSQKLPVLTTKGSYAGALGIPQFMPTSYVSFGVDYSQNHHIDLINNHDDAIASIGNYLHEEGWHYKQPVAYPAQLYEHKSKKFSHTRATIDSNVAQLNWVGAYTHEKVSPHQKAGLLALKERKKTAYWFIFPNFKTIMRYNASAAYAMAVYQLSEKIRTGYEQQAGAGA